MDIERKEKYETLQERRLRKEVVLSEIRRDNQQIGILWKELFKKPAPKKKGLTLASVMSTGAGLADGFMLVWKLYRKYKRK